MDKNTSIGILLFVCLTVSQLLPGCAYEPSLPPSTTSGFSMKDLEQRTKGLKDLRLQESTSDKDRKIASSLLSAYESIRTVLMAGELSAQELKELGSIFEDLTDIESLYFSEGADEPVSPKEAMAGFTKARKQIFEDYLFGDYQRVIDRCVVLEADYGKAALTTEVGLLFSLSLGKRGYYQQALQVGEGLVPKLKGLPDIIALETQILAWHLELGQKEEALATLDGLIDSLGERQAQFRGAQAMLSLDGGKTISEAHGAEHTTRPLPNMDAVEGSIEAVLQEIDHLVSARHFNEAKERLITYRAHLPEGPDMDRVDQAIQAVALSEEKYFRENYDKVQQRQTILEEARRLIDEEHYEMALAMIDDLRTEGEMTPEAEGLKALATEKHINLERSQAAKMFLLARNTNEVGKRRELLHSSRQILSDLIEKYPSSPLIDRIISHLEKVDREIEKLNGSGN